MAVVISSSVNPSPHTSSVPEGELFNQQQCETEYTNRIKLFSHDLFDYFSDVDALQRSEAGLQIDASPAQDMLEDALNNIQDMKEAKDSLSSWEIYADVVKKLNTLQSDYMDIYSEVTEKYQQFMSEFNQLKTKMSDLITAGKDEVTISRGSISELLTDFRDKWKTKTILLKVDNEEVAKYWKEQLGLDYQREDQGGSFVFFVNTSPVEDMLVALWERPNTTDVTISVSMAAFNEWQNTINSANSTVESDTQVVSQKYSQANTLFNNLAKILSSTMDALYQADKEFLRN
ncbi:MAG: IpaD/SipD/SspD family type III secretion system needle tip protein [Enterobacterales bacterium endosymbiont of Blomia tropicalis]|uniref:IpaD/SipD/SspD family type III secretion system needle tip protein n=1 Tax=Mixta mediterraneensis TaxID=2758443 RepID=UPI0025A72C25|nr:IpaD/SipD/SspD family type III secretion system needle tip protein [Mixta mediterraneensis]MDL4914961.1 IpaD/SipD/SspD family type III secretion system needle tip protein [Mixta mediterraneensis]